eukprot:gene11087-biopygen18364
MTVRFCCTVLPPYVVCPMFQVLVVFSFLPLVAPPPPPMASAGLGGGAGIREKEKRTWTRARRGATRCNSHRSGRGPASFFPSVQRPKGGGGERAAGVAAGGTGHARATPAPPQAKKNAYSPRHARVMPA